MGAWRGVSPLHKARCVCKDVNLVFALSLSTCPTQLPTVLTSFWPYVFIFWTPLATPLSPELRNWRKSSIPVPSPALKWPIFTSCFLCFMSRVFVCTCICFFSQKFTNCWSGLLFFFSKSIWYCRRVQWCLITQLLVAWQKGRQWHPNPDVSPGTFQVITS